MEETRIYRQIVELMGQPATSRPDFCGWLAGGVQVALEKFEGEKAPRYSLEMGTMERHFSVQGPDGFVTQTSRSALEIFGA